MKDDGSLLPMTAAASATATSAAASKRESLDSILFGRGRYKFWALAAILLLALWSMFAGTVTLRWSAGNLNHLSDYDLDLPVRDDLDVLEMEEREKMVKHMWDVYTNSRRIRLPKFWQDAFEAAFQDLMSDSPEVKEAAITEIAKMSIHYIDSPPFSSTEISIAAKVPQKEIGKYIKKILGEALQQSQPINSNSISVHMPRFCTLLQLNKSAQELATHIGEVVMKKCFCTRRNPISISAAAIYLACQLEDKRKTQAEICKVTGLTGVTLRKVYKELLENWDDLLPSNYTPAVPPEKAFPSSIPSSRAFSTKAETTEVILLDENVMVKTKPAKISKDKSVEAKSSRFSVVTDLNQLVRVKDDADASGLSQTQRVPVTQVTFSPAYQHSVNGLRGERNNDGGKDGHVMDMSSDYQYLVQKGR